MAISGRLLNALRNALNDNASVSQLLALLGSEGVGASQVLTGGLASIPHPTNKIADENNILDGSGGGDTFTVPADGDYVLELSTVVQVLVTA